MQNTIKCLVSVAIPLAVGALGSFFTMESVGTWYTTIEKPFFNPPNWIFGPVWTLLFILMGVAFYLVWKKNFGNDKQKTIGIYAAQLVLNFVWSILFFALHSPLLALINILILWVLIFLNIKIFGKIDPKAGYLLVPYLAWVSFATLLNASIVWLN